MKLALITDTHWGIRGDSVHLHDLNKKFLDNVFFPYLEKNNITTTIHLGDLVDRKKFINWYTANRVRNDFIIPLGQRNIDTHLIIGNHDTFYRNTNSVNAQEELLDSRFNNIKIYTNTTEVNLDIPILFVPWICKDNREDTLEKIKNTSAQICMGHLELDGFSMYKGIPSLHGDDPKIFEKFDVVCSGHYHHRSNNSNIHYLGASAEFTWSDYNDPRGFAVFDTENRTLVYVNNPYTLFTKIFYDDGTSYKESVKNKIVKVIVKNKTDPYEFDKFISTIEEQNPIELQVVEDHLNLDIAEDTVIDEAESTIDIFKKYIEKATIPNVDKKLVESTVIDLYTEAMSMEVSD